MNHFKLYTKNNCVQCIAVKKYLEKNNVQYETINIDFDEEAMEVVKNLGVRQAPVLYLNDEVFSSGFNIPDMEKVLKQN